MEVLAAVDIFAHCLGLQDNGQGRAPTAETWKRLPNAILFALKESGMLTQHGLSYQPSMWMKSKMLDSAVWFLKADRRAVELIEQVFEVET